MCVYAARWRRGGAVVSHTQRFLIRQWMFLTCHLAGLLCVPSEVLPALALWGAAWGFAKSRAEAELWLAAWPEPMCIYYNSYPADGSKVSGFNERSVL